MEYYSYINEYFSSILEENINISDFEFAGGITLTSKSDIICRSNAYFIRLS